MPPPSYLLKERRGSDELESQAIAGHGAGMRRHPGSADQRRHHRAGNPRGADAMRRRGHPGAVSDDGRGQFSRPKRRRRSAVPSACAGAVPPAAASQGGLRNGGALLPVGVSDRSGAGHPTASGGADRRRDRPADDRFLHQRRARHDPPRGRKGDAGLLAGRMDSADLPSVCVAVDRSRGRAVGAPAERRALSAVERRGNRIRLR